MIVPLVVASLALIACGDDDTPGKDTTTDATTSPDGTDATTADGTDATSPDGTDATSPDGTDATSPDGDTTGDTSDTDVEPPESCETPIPAAPQGELCGVVSGNQSALLIRANLILPTGILEQGGILVVDGMIACVGCDCATNPSALGATVFNCPDAVVSPGLINAHDHITYGQGKPIPHGTTRYDHRNEWRNGGGPGKPEIPYEDNPDDNGAIWGEMRQVMAGTTSLFGASGPRAMLRNLDVAAGLEGLTHPYVRSSIFPLGSSGIYASGCDRYDLPSPNAGQGGSAYVPHVSEGVLTGARNEFICLDGQQEGGVDVVNEKTAFIHGIGATAADIALFVGEGAALVWSPRSNTDLYGFTAEAPLYHKLGGQIALGTDWTFSGSVNMLRELACAEQWNARWDHYFSDQQLVNMATSWGAAALGFDDVLGSLTVGKVADITIWDARDNQGYRAILDAGVDDVALVLRGGPPPLLDGSTQFGRGRPLYGDPALVDALQDRAIRFTDPPACDLMADVCGRPKKFCVAEQLGPTLGLDEVRASLDASYTYGLFFCGVPDNEPTCVPMRPNEFSGAMTELDPDGDDLTGPDDNCPAWFNAPRPMDNMTQPDTDDDGVGDLCDVCPFDADTEACTSVNPDDIDGDGILNDADKCPNIADDQTDTDLDGIGDACDLCPTESNLGGKPCPSTIYKVKDGTVAMNTAVALSGVVCVVVGPEFFTVQVKDAPVPENSGLYVFSGSAGTKCTPGTLIDVQGTVEDYFGQIQMTDATWSVTPGSTTVPLPAPVVVAPADVAVGGAKAKALEAVLVEVRDVMVTSTTPVAEVNGQNTENVAGEFIVTGNLRVDDALYAIVPAPEVGKLFPVLRGVLRYSWNKNKLLPRSADDVIEGPPELVGFEPADGAMYEGDVGGPFVVRLSRGAEGPTDVTVTSGDESKATVVATVTVPDGATTAPVVVTAIAAAESVTLTAKLGVDGDPKTATLRIVPAGTVPAVASVEAPAKVYVGDDFDVTVTLDLPAPTGGQQVTLAYDPTGLFVSEPTTLTILAGARTGTVALTAGATAGTATITASTTAGEAEADVEISDAEPPAEVVFCFEDATGTYIATPTVDLNTTAASTFTIAAALTSQADASGAEPRPAACTGTNNRAPNRAGWPTGTARDETKYYQITVAHSAGTYKLEFDIRSSSTGPKKYDVVSSTGGVLVTGADYTGDTAFQHVTWTGALPGGTNVIRIHGYGGSAATGTFRLDNVQLLPAE
ncbi:MAG: amidohydrolase family protein [Deltaproteobacteria bacterium]|nr:amidohydrolase family protein [Deltaproteobacteria bacterium]